MPTDDEVSTLEVVKEVLENAFYLTDAFAAEKEVTASSICCILAHQRNKLGVKEGDKKLAIDMKNIMLTIDTANINLFKFLRCVSFLTRDLRLNTLEIKRLLWSS